MKTLWVACYLIILTAKAFSQIAEKDISRSTCILDVQKQPEFRGGQDAFIKFLHKNLRRPKGSEAIQGRVILSFTVRADGHLADFTIMKSLQPDYDKEVIRVLKLSSPWKPKIENGKSVKCRYSIPIVFDANLISYKKISSDTTIYPAVDQSPQFPGGYVELGKYLSKFKPKMTIEQLQSRFIFRFVVEKDGKISNYQFLNPVNNSIEKEAVDFLKTMPKWKPGKLNGRVVRVSYSLPLTVCYAEE
ncbi:MAG: TonB family protein [Mucilaginibacter sp.]|nr:TonB family protein [Mucilaginibacter sp.]